MFIVSTPKSGVKEYYRSAQTGACPLRAEATKTATKIMTLRSMAKMDLPASIQQQGPEHCSNAGRSIR
jgi:hypothetical protein